MAVLNGFYKASYSIGGKKALFYARTCQEPQIGRKTVVHEYPQSDTRYVQDNGKISGVYTLQVQIQETTPSAYKKAISTLRKALETAGIGTLTHPELGKKKVVPTSSSRYANIVSENGISSFTLTFMESDPNKYPISQAGNAGFLSSIYDSISAANETYFGGIINGYNSFIEGFNDLRDGIQTVTNTITDIVATINGIADEAAAITTDIADFQSSLTTLIQTPTTLAARLNAIFATLANITDNFENLFNATNGNVNTSQPTLVAASSTQADSINQNRIATNNFSNAAYLNIAYLASINISYTSQDQVNEVISQLNTSFLSLDPDTVDEDVYYLLQDMRVQNRLYLENLRLNLPYQKIIYTNSIPASILAYNLYGDSRRADEIIDVNEIEDPAFVCGDVTVLSE